MALVAINAVIYVPRNVRMLKIVGVVTTVTCRALEHGVIVRVGMAGGAYVVSASMVGWEWRVLGVVKRRSRPCSRCVTSLARGREELGLRLVARVRGVAVIRLVAPDTRDRQSRVVPVYVAVRALARRHGVRTGQRECRVGVVEGGVGPDCGVVAQLTRGRESRRSMGGIVSARIILLMARVAQRAV